ERRQREGGGPTLAVEATQVFGQEYTVRLQSYGTVQPRTQSILVAQVTGQVVSINDDFREGGYFEKGDVLLTIDDRDYAADVRIAEASLMDARQALAEAAARSEQALQDWQRLGNPGEPSDLVLRKPQLAAAEARVISARSALEKTRLDFERTKIIAPFDGRVLRQLVDLGQVVGNNTQVAEIYSTDTVEVRLPLRNSDLAFIDLPENYRNSAPEEATSQPNVTLRSSLGANEAWQGEIVRAEGAIDPTARQLHVVAEIDDPFGADNIGRSPLKIGEYVTAELEGKTLTDVILIPNGTIYQGSYVYVVENDLLLRRDIQIAWQNEEHSIIANGLANGDTLVTTPLGQVTSGLAVRLLNGSDGNKLTQDKDTKPPRGGTGANGNNPKRKDETS
ncbi:MAG: efflux RND transporter periplasmic adaptor subunit, partial [Pseudomonadota bacterium]